MAKADRTAKLLEELDLLKRSERSPEGVRRLKEIFKAKEPLPVVKAVTIAEKWEARDLAEDLTVLFARFMELPDPGCAVKENVARVLCDWGPTDGGRIFERGIRYIQMEAVWGGRVDVAAGLRGWCAAGLSSMGYWDQVRLILPLLVDAEKQARIMGIRALVQGRSSEAEVALRLKMLTGDIPQAEPEDAEEVMTECLYGLAEGWGAKVVGFLVEMTGKGTYRRLALFALARCRADEAWESLARLFEAEVVGTRRKELLEAMATARSEKAVSWMCERIRNGRDSEAIETVRAMTIRREETRVWDRVVEAARENGSEDVLREI